MMRSLISKGATVAIIVMASGVAAGQRVAFNRPSIVDRIFSFDANRDDRIARDELPERMEGLVSRGDKNEDGFLTRDEVIALVDTQSPARRTQQFSRRGVASLADIITDLKLPPMTHDRAMAIVSAVLGHVKEHAASRSINVPASDELYAAMRTLLDDEDYENFVAAATRLRNTPRFAGGIAGGVVRK
jgi:hypothetical protein